VRIHPALDIPKTPAVKALLAQVALAIKGKFPAASIGKTNLEEYLG
jgi:hypothetical protein